MKKTYLMDNNELNYILDKLDKIENSLNDIRKSDVNERDMGYSRARVYLNDIRQSLMFNEQRN